MNRDKFRQTIVVTATLIMLTVNALANSLPINGLTTGEISNQFNTYFVPAGYVFSIWGLIYLLLLAFTVYQALPSQKTNPALRKIAWWYVAGSLANSAWIFCWHYQRFPLSLGMMAILLVSLIAIYEMLEIGLVEVSAGMRFFVHLPFSIYLGWITVATIANVADVLDYLKWGGFGLDARLWAVIMMVVAVVVAELTTYNRRDLAYLAVLVWAFIGIAQNSKGLSPVIEAAYVAAATITIMALISIALHVRQRVRKKR